MPLGHAIDRGGEQALVHLRELFPQLTMCVLKDLLSAYKRADCFVGGAAEGRRFNYHKQSAEEIDTLEPFRTTELKRPG